MPSTTYVAPTPHQFLFLHEFASKAIGVDLCDVLRRHQHTAPWDTARFPDFEQVLRDFMDITDANRWAAQENGWDWIVHVLCVHSGDDEQCKSILEAMLENCILEPTYGVLEMHAMYDNSGVALDLLLRHGADPNGSDFKTMGDHGWGKDEIALTLYEQANDAQRLVLDRHGAVGLPIDFDYAMVYCTEDESAGSALTDEDRPEYEEFRATPQHPLLHAMLKKRNVHALDEAIRRIARPNCVNWLVKDDDEVYYSLMEFLLSRCDASVDELATMAAALVNAGHTVGGFEYIAMREEREEKDYKKIHCAVKHALAQRPRRHWTRIRRIALLVGRIALFVKAMHEFVLQPGGPVAKRACRRFEATVAHCQLELCV